MPVRLKHGVQKMRKMQINHYKSLLNNKIDILLGKFDQTVDRMSGASNPFPDPTDRAAMESDRNVVLRIRDRERKLFLKVRKALLKIDEGSYGLCESCGEPISRNRLEARPEAVLCIECKNELEEMEKLRRANRI